MPLVIVLVCHETQKFGFRDEATMGSKGLPHAHGWPLMNYFKNIVNFLLSVIFSLLIFLYLKGSPCEISVFIRLLI